MARPVKKRKLAFFPENYRFIPETDTDGIKDEITLSHEELESIRLADVEKLEQAQAAEMMNVSRGTYQRILNTAREKAAKALVYGHSLSVSGGNYELNACNAVCESCGHVWKAPCNVIFYENDGKCPKCGSPSIGCSGKNGKCSLGESRHNRMLKADSRQKYQS